MESIAVFVNDVAAARHVLQPMLQSAEPTRWVLVACPPSLTRHAGRWVAREARRQWRDRWAAALFDALTPALRAGAGNLVETHVPRGALAEEAARLQARLPNLRLLDARQHRIGRFDEPIVSSQPAASGAVWAAPASATAGLTMMLALAD